MLVFLVICAQILSDTLANDNLQVAYQWNQMDFNFSSAAHRDSAIKSGLYIPSSVVPVGIEVQTDRLFITLPRWKSGVPASLAFINMNGKIAIFPIIDTTIHLGNPIRMVFFRDFQLSHTFFLTNMSHTISTSHSQSPSLSVSLACLSQHNTSCIISIQSRRPRENMLLYAWGRLYMTVVFSSKNFSQKNSLLFKNAPLFYLQLLSILNHQAFRHQENSHPKWANWFRE